jgi:hypothetical protein
MYGTGLRLTLNFLLTKGVYNETCVAQCQCSNSPKELLKDLTLTMEDLAWALKQQKKMSFQNEAPS